MAGRCLFLALLWCSLGLWAQDADVVVINDSRLVTVEESGPMEYERSVSYKLLNAKAKWAAQWHMGLDKNTKLIAFSGVLSDANGRVLIKIKKSDLKSTQLSKGMADDITTAYLELTPPVYPCMLTIDVKVRKTDGVLSYPVFFPANRPRMAVQHADYTLVMPAAMKCRWHVENMTQGVVETLDDKGRTVYSIACDNVEPFEDAGFAPDIAEVVPMAFFAPNAFSYDRWTGKMDTWAAFGKWHADLLEGRQVLPEPLKDQLHQIADTCSSPWSKVDVLYRWLQRNTRYVSIQLGVGGLQPFTAEEVWKNGFGDCKGLSNLMVSMLREVGIPAHYVIIGTESKKLFHDYPNANQFNHAIAMALLPNDTVWLECTNRNLPTGYLHEGIAGHEALAIMPQGGRIVSVPAYMESQNKVKSSMYVHLHEDGSADIDWNMRAGGSKYRDFFALALMDGTQRKTAVKELIRLSQAEVEGIEVDDHREKPRTPELVVSCKAHAANVASVTGKRLFLTLKPMLSFPKDLADGERKLDIVVEEGGEYEYALDIDLPEGYEVESAPTTMMVDSPYGSSSFEFAATPGNVRIRHFLTLRRGTYPADNLSEFRAYLRSALMVFAQKVVLRKTTS